MRDSTGVFRIVGFVRAVGRHCGVLLTGGVLLGGVAIWQRIGHTVRPSVYWSIATITLFIAFVRAWNDQLNAAEQIRSELVVLQSRIEKLEGPADRPLLSFHRWGQEENQTHARAFQRGFYLRNHGGTAWEIQVESLRIGDAFTTHSSPVAQIASNGEGFAPVWIENQSPLGQWDLDGALQRILNEMIDTRQLRSGQALVVPVAVTYRDFDYLWYRSVGTLAFVHDRIEFTAVRQERFGGTKPAPPW
jgi:hypothetical protein